VIATYREGRMIRRIWAYAGIIIALAFLPFALFYLLLPNYFDLTYLVPAIGGMLVVAFSFSIFSPMPEGVFYSDLALSQIADRLRLQGLLVKEKPHTVTVQINRWVGVEIGRGKSSNREMRWRLDATPSSLSLIIFSFITGPISFINAPLAIYLLHEGDRYIREFIHPALEGKVDKHESKRAPIKDLLIVGLSESRRISWEAYLSASSAYSNNILIVALLVGLCGWALSFGYLFTSGLFEPNSRLALSLLISITFAIVAAYLVGKVATRRLKTQVIQIKGWFDRLDVALIREIHNEKVDDGTSSIELLFDAYDQIPIWLKAKGKELFYTHPAGYILIVYLVLLAGMTGFSGLVSIFSSGLNLEEVILILLGCGFAFGAGLVRRELKKRDRADDQNTTQEFDRRRKTLSQIFEQEFGEA